MSIFITFLLAIHVVVSLLIILLVLMQRPKSEGLGAAFGGGMTDNLFGAQTTNVLQKATRVLGAMFFALTLVLSMLYSRQARNSFQSSIEKQLTSAPQPKPVEAQPKSDNLVIPADSIKSADDITKIIEKKVQEDQATASPTPANTTAPSATDKSKEDLKSPSLQLQVPSGTAPERTDTEERAVTALPRPA